MPRGHVHPDGRQIARLRGEADLTQWQLATLAGYGLRTIGKIEDDQPTSAGTLAAVATVLERRLRRPIRTADLICRSPGDACSCLRQTRPSGVVQEEIQLLDFAAWRPATRNGHTTAESRVVLTDRYRFLTVPEMRALDLYYTTTGARIDGQCLTHPHDWLPVQGANGHGIAQPYLTSAYLLHVDLTAAAAGPLVIENRLEYIDAFPTAAGGWFQTHVIYPTESLTVVALLAEGKPCRTAAGKGRYHPVEPFTPVADGPSVLAKGRLVHWHIPAPQRGGTYQLEWEW